MSEDLLFGSYSMWEMEQMKGRMRGIHPHVCTPLPPVSIRGFDELHLGK